MKKLDAMGEPMDGWMTLLGSCKTRINISQFSGKMGQNQLKPDQNHIYLVQLASVQGWKIGRKDGQFEFRVNRKSSEQLIGWPLDFEALKEYCNVESRLSDLDIKEN